MVAMYLIFIVFAIAAIYFEQMGNPVLSHLGIDQIPGIAQAGGNMEGKEIRLGIVGTGLFTAVTTGASCGAINGMMDSLTPLGGAVPLVLMQLGEVVFGGVGTGLYNMLVFAIMAVFIGRPHDRQNTGISWQENRVIRYENGLHLHSGYPACRTAGNGGGNHDKCRSSGRP